MAATEQQPDRRTERRAARRAANRDDILNAAEVVFARSGIRDGSLREIAAESGFSTAGLYLFFDNKQHLLAETLTRRGDELLALLRETIATDAKPLEQLHLVIDASEEFHAARPEFVSLLGQLRGGHSITGPVLAGYAADVDERFTAVMDLLADVVTDGQARGEIRAGDAHALAHLYSVLVNEHIFLKLDPTDPRATPLSRQEFHALVDSALRAPDQRRRE
ncbi:MAG: TetR family transcriptional regulator [Acidimicrobiia bacterium]